MMGALVSFTAMAICGRELSVNFSTSQIMFWRGLVALIFVIIFLQFSGWRQIRTGVFFTHSFRAFAHFGAQFCWFYAIPLITLAELFALEFTMPIWAAILAALFLGEHLTKIRILAIGLGFVGVMIIIRPGISIEIGTGAYFALVAAFGYGIATVTMRMLAQCDSPLCILFYMSIIQVPLGGILALNEWEWPDLISHGPLILMIGLSGLSAHYCMANAMRLAEATVVVTMDFMRLPLIAVVGYLFYEEILEVWVGLGAVLICIGIYLIVNEANRRAV